MNFKELGLSEKTIKAIEESGITQPTTVQIDVIPSILAGKDVFAIAPSGCGKTCSYVLPLIDIISRHEARNILIITAGSKQSVVVSDRFAVFNKYHEVTENTLTEQQEKIDEEANVIIASPGLLLDLIKEEKADLSNVDILVVDDINLIKKYHQLNNLEQVLALLPADKQNIIFTNRRSKETQSILDKILQTPEEIKVDRNKEQEAVQNEDGSAEQTEIAEKSEDKPSKSVKNVRRERGQKNNKKEKTQSAESAQDAEALELVQKYHVFGRKTPAYMLTVVELATDE